MFLDGGAKGFQHLLPWMQANDEDRSFFLGEHQLMLLSRQPTAFTRSAMLSNVMAEKNNIGFNYVV
jgi:hypothetical protein